MSARPAASSRQGPPPPLGAWLPGVTAAVFALVLALLLQTHLSLVHYLEEDPTPEYGFPLRAHHPSRATSLAWHVDLGPLLANLLLCGGGGFVLAFPVLRRLDRRLLLVLCIGQLPMLSVQLLPWVIQPVIGLTVSPIGDDWPVRCRKLHVGRNLTYTAVADPCADSQE